MIRQNTMDRTNTYLSKEYFKVIVLGSNKEKAEIAAQWLTGQTVANRGVYGCPYNKSQMIVFYRWPGQIDRPATTVAVEAIIVFCESLKDLKTIQPEISAYGPIPVRVVISKEDLTYQAREIKAVWYPQEDTSKGLKTKLDELDKAELQVIQQIFQHYDTDESGAIDSTEMREIAVSLGENPDTEDFKESMLALDYNKDGTISFTEFIAWWKIGRQNTITLPKIYRLQLAVEEFMEKTVDFPRYVKTIEEVNNKKIVQKNNQRIYFKSPGTFKLKSFLEISLAVGGTQKNEMAINFIKQFTKNISIARNNWVSILLTLDRSKTKLNISRARALLEDFKENVIKWGEIHSNPTLISFVKNLLLFEFNSTDNSVIMVARMKIDVEELVKRTLHKILFIAQNTPEKDDSFWFNIKTHSNADFLDAVKQEVTIGDFLRTSELDYEGSVSRHRIKTLFESLKPDVKKKLELLKLLLYPYDLDLEFEGDLNEFVDEESKNVLGVSLEKVGFLLDFLTKNISTELLASCNNIEIGMNIFDVFARVKYYSKSVFS